jgi:glycosyltransferase involved in cell wall biosynthesis
MATGQVVLVSRRGGQAEYVRTDGKDGFLFDWEAPEGFETKLIQVLGLTQDERLTMGTAAQASVYERCHSEQVLARQVEFYAATAERHRPYRVFPSVNRELEQVTEIPKFDDDEHPGLLSIIIPYYNLGKYLPEALESVLASTYRPREIIIVDDESDELESQAVLKTIAARGIPEVRVLYQSPNQGAAMTRNKGAAAARGEFIAFLDADDRIDPGFYIQAIDLLRRYDNVMFVYGWRRTFGQQTTVWTTWNTELPALAAYELVGSPIGVIRRQRFLNYGQNKAVLEHDAEDIEMYLSLVVAGGLGVALPWPVTSYRLRGDSKSHRVAMGAKTMSWNLIADLHPQTYRRYGVELFNLLKGRELELAQQFNELHGWTEQLESDKRWLDEQRLAWKTRTERAEQKLARLRTIPGARLFVWLAKTVFGFANRKGAK